MSLPQEQESEALETRRDSLLRYRKDYSKTPPFLEVASGAEELSALQKEEKNDYPQGNPSARHTNKGVITITMERSSFIGIIIATLVLVIASFIAGLLSYYYFFSHKTTPPSPAAAIEKSVTKPLKNLSQEEVSTPKSNSESLAKEALSIAGQEKTPPSQIKKSQSKKESEPSAAQEKPKGEISTLAGQLSSRVSAKEKELKSKTQTQKEALKTPSTFYTISLGEVSSSEQGEAMKDELKKLGLETYIQAVNSPYDRIYYSISYGKFSTYVDARTALLNLPKPYSLWGRIKKVKVKKATKES